MDTNITFQEVGNNIHFFLKEKNLTQQALADTLGISKQVMTKIINGKKAINVSEIANIAEKLGTTTDCLLQPSPKKGKIQDFSFMGSIKNEETRKKIGTLNEVIKEILLLEGLSDEA
jgi:transcriptional regulator with XRE-family HTH domain